MPSTPITPTPSFTHTNGRRIPFFETPELFAEFRSQIQHYRLEEGSLCRVSNTTLDNAETSSHGASDTTPAKSGTSSRRVSDSIVDFEAAARSLPQGTSAQTNGRRLLEPGLQSPNGESAGGRRKKVSEKMLRKLRKWMGM